MLKKEYKMPQSRLVRYFKGSRDNWKDKALKKQHKLRGLEQKVRDLEKSRDKWKRKAKEEQKKRQELEKELEKREKKSNSSCEVVMPVERAIYHHYTISMIQISVRQVIEGGNSYRSVSKNLKILSENLSINAPHYSSIIKWVGRVGLYELKRKKEQRNDWIFLIDLTLELGQEKAIVIYGISQEKYQEIVEKYQRALLHTDGEILSIEVTKTATGELIEEKLEQLSSLVGIPIQILGDHGSNVKKGIELYQQKYPEVIYTYDVTHAMSNLLKNELSKDECYKEFVENCHKCRQKIQQTELGFLAPPSQRSQCRYFNVERLVDWGLKILNAPVETIVKLMPTAELKVIYQRLKDKMSWLINYENALKKWEIMVFLTRTLETQIKIDGLNKQSLHKYNRQISSREIPENLEKFKEKIVKYITQEMNYLKDKKSILATTDVLESIFGKYKQFSARCPLKELRQMLLSIPLSTMKLTADIIKEALETIGNIEVEEWIRAVFGQSMLSKRKTLFKASYYQL